MTSPALQWNDPFQDIWGFHIHQELPLQVFPKALVIQRQCAEFLALRGLTIDAAQVFRPGYGPHLDYMWELRIEHQPREVLRYLGLAVSYLAVNRLGLSAYVHPLRHDPRSANELEMEGRLNQANTLWFGYKVRQNQDFFFHPPLDEHGIVDTRTPAIMSEDEIASLYAQGREELREEPLCDPGQVIRRGYHLHLRYEPDEAPLALQIFDRFHTFLLEQGLRPTSSRFYGCDEKGPFRKAGWEVKLEIRGEEILRDIGIALGWLMANRQDLPVFLLPVTWEPGDCAQALRAHRDNALFIGEPPVLDLSFFQEKLPASRGVC